MFDVKAAGLEEYRAKVSKNVLGKK